MIEYPFVSQAGEKYYILKDANIEYTIYEPYFYKDRLEICIQGDRDDGQWWRETGPLKADVKEFTRLPFPQEEWNRILKSVNYGT